MRRVVIPLLVVVAMAACRKAANRPVAEQENKVAPRVARLFFESDSMLLSPEPRNLNLPQYAAAAIPAVLTELLKGPANPALSRLLPADTVLRGAFLLPDGTAVVDLGGPTLTRGWPAGSHEEVMAVQSIIVTLTTNFPDAKRVRLLLNGVNAETLAGHVAIDRSLSPDPSVVDRRLR